MKTSQASIAVLAQEPAVALVQAWVTERLHNSALAADTASWNHLVAQLPDLARRITDLLNTEK